MSYSGGLVYHWRALRYQKHQWIQHRNCVFNFLEAWLESMRAPREKSIVLIGSSGGYSLPVAFLKSFDSITIYEPDFLARMIFERRFKAIASRVSWIKQPYDFKSDLPPGAVLFCNILGQIDIADIEKLKSDLARVLKGRDWASYHDALSGERVRWVIPQMAQPKADLSRMQAWMEVRATRPVNLIAHLAPDLFDGAGQRFFYWQWRISQKRTHLIEGVFSHKVDE